MSNPVAWVILVSNKGRSFLMLNQDNDVWAFTSKSAGLSAFERPYGEAHRRDAQSSASAALHWMAFAPVVVPVMSLEEMNGWLLRTENGAAPVYTLSTMSGRMVGVEIKPELSDTLKSMGTQVTLIRNEMLA